MKVIPSKHKRLKSPLFLFFLILTLFYYLSSSYCWIRMYVPKIHYFLVFYNFIFIIYLITLKKTAFSKKILWPMMLLLLITAVTTLQEDNFLIALTTFLTYLPAILLFLLPIEKKYQVLSFITKWFCIIIGISVVLYILTFVIHLPNIGTYKADDDFYPLFRNYVFFIKSTDIIESFRFNGPFLEPGHLSIVIAFLLFANDYDFKNNRLLWILIVALFVSFSLSGWMLTIIGWLLLNYQKIKLVPIIMGLACFVWISNWYNGGDNVVNNLILSRLELDDKKGIKGNNRFSHGTDILYEKMVDNGSVWIGKGSQFKSKDVEGAGYKIYFIRQGAFMALMILFLYALLGSYSTSKKYTISFLIILGACFLSRGYPNWYSWLLPYILGTSIYNSPLRLRK